MNKAEEIISAAADFGYEKCGIVNVDEMQGYAEKLSERIERFPEIKTHFEKYFAFADVRSVFPWAKAIIVCARWYGRYRIPDIVKGRIGKYFLTDTRKDKNTQELKNSIAFEKYLNSLGVKTESSRDSSITALRWAAMKAGIGIIRKNNFFYTEKGSWVHLEAFLIDNEMECLYEHNIKPCPEKCGLCVEACPTGSLVGPYMMNRSTCIACLTAFEGWDLTSDKNSSNMGNWVYGCDLCQNACPFNKDSWKEEEDFPFLSELCEKLSLTQIVEADYSFLENVVQQKFWYIPKEKVWRYKTNALNAMLNRYKPEYLSSIQNACDDENENVRKMAKWVLSKVRGGPEPLSLKNTAQ